MRYFKTMRLRSLNLLTAALALIAFALAAASCSNLQQVETFPAEPGFVADDLPEIRPADFKARFRQTGGMAPWSERLDIEDGKAQYSVWMSDITYVFDYTPSDSQLDELYAKVRGGRFGEYLVIPFKEGEEVYDAGDTSYAVTVGDVSHRIGLSEEELVIPDTDAGPEGSPLVALRSFADMPATPTADERLTIRYDDAISELYLNDLEVRFDLGDSPFAMGDERWASEFIIGWSGGPRDVAVSISNKLPDGERSTLLEQTVAFESASVLKLQRTPDDGIELVLSALS